MAEQNDDARTGISNRESAPDEARERSAHPPLIDTPSSDDETADRSGDEPISERSSQQTSRKAGSRSLAQKQSEARYDDGSMPASTKVPGAFGKEPAD